MWRLGSQVSMLIARGSASLLYLILLSPASDLWSSPLVMQGSTASRSSQSAMPSRGSEVHLQRLSVPRQSHCSSLSGQCSVNNARRPARCYRIGLAKRPASHLAPPSVPGAWAPTCRGPCPGPGEGCHAGKKRRDSPPLPPLGVQGGLPGLVPSRAPGRRARSGGRPAGPAASA